MFEKIIQAIIYFIPVRSYASDLEEYIESRCPQNAADIDRYSREYSQKVSNGGWL